MNLRRVSGGLGARLRSRAAVAGLAVIAAGLLAPGPEDARASFVTVGSSPGGAPTLFYTSLPNEANDLTIMTDGNEFVVSDQGAPQVTPLNGCSPTPSQQVVRCPKAGVLAMQIDLADRDDRSRLDDTVFATVEAVRTNGGDGNDVLVGGQGRDIVSGDDGDDVVESGAGADTVFGGDGDDRVDAGPGEDTASGDAGRDTIDGSDGDDDLHGGTGDDALRGGSGADKLDVPGAFETIGEPGTGRSAGSDTLEGGAGDDTLSGG